jgi:leucyl-tRNA synthetase
MELVNALQSLEPLEEGARPAVVKGVLELLVLMLAPMSPHLCEELWEMLGHIKGLNAERWPDYIPELAREEQVEIPVQVNGRVRSKICVDAGLSDDELVEKARSDSRIAPFLAGKNILKRIVVPNRLVNLVTD